MEIFKLIPAYKDNLWGGTKLKTEWNKKTDLPVVAESWELSCHDAGLSVIENGTFAGKTLKSVLTPAMLGKNAAHFPFFPVLIKLIDAKDNLSVQVHPSDDYALKNEGEYGKTEMWYVVDAEPGAGLYCGLKQDLTEAEFRKKIADKTLVEALQFFPVKPGDAFFIPSGTVHAIGAGVTICEIQQNSNLTYRVYDYGRVDKKTGKERELHVEKALKVADLTVYRDRIVPKEERAGVSLLASCNYFTVRRLAQPAAGAVTADENSFLSLTALSGAGTIAGLPYRKGDTFFLPAGFGKAEITGESVWIETRV